MTGYFTGSKYLSESLRSKGYVGEGLPIGRKLSEKFKGMEGLTENYPRFGD